MARDAAKVRIGNIWFTIKFEIVVLTGGPLYPKFDETFKDNTENVKQVIEDTIAACRNKEDEGLIKKSLRILKDLAVGATGSLIASGILALLGQIHV